MSLLSMLLLLFAGAGPTTDDGTWFVLPDSDAKLGAHHTRHAEVFGKYVSGYNARVLAGVDKVQSSQPEGGGYFTGVTAQPAESPIGYPLALFGQPLLAPPRTTSYCSGSSYSAFIESLNMILPDGAKQMSPERFEALHMQEPDGGRREDWVKFWGMWNADGPGSQYALVQYSGAGTEIKPINARPGDFTNIDWKSGLGHSVVFLGWYKDEQGGKQVLYWSSQKGTNGLGDQLSPIEKIRSVKVVRLTNPEKLFTFDVNTKVQRKVPGDTIDWEMNPMNKQDANDTGASRAWTSDDPVIKKSIALLSDGKFNEAQSLLASDDGNADPQVMRTRDQMADLIVRFRHEYSQNEGQLLDKLKKQIPDVSPIDLKKWREGGELQYRTIDGQVMYFRREPSNLFRFCAEAKQRAGKSDAAAPAKWKLVDHLKEVVTAAESSENAEVCPLKHRIEYALAIPANTREVKAGSLVRIWLPYPQEYRQQKDVKLVTATLNGSNYEPQIAPNGTPQRVGYFEQKVADPSKPIEAKIVFEYTSFAYYPKLDDAKVQPLPVDLDQAYLRERPPHIVFTPQIKQLVAQIIDGESNALVRARKIFHWIDANIRYHAEEEYCLIPGFAAACLSRHKGDCGIQSTLFITMCRAAGIPARWQSGWETKPVGWTMHDWCEIYIAPWGWIPCDASYGVQKSDDPKIADFYVGHQDSHRMIVNLDYGRELVPPKPSLRSEPADFQRGEVEIDGKNLYFDDWDYNMRIWIDGKEI